MKKEFIISFDIPTQFSSFRTKINRKLKRIGAIKIHESFWKSENLKELIDIAIRIKMIGGNASILEEKFIF